jgi:hypothetical protein
VKKKLRLIDLLKIAREWRRQGYTGSRPVIKVVSFIPARRIREVIAEFKKRKKQRYNFYRKRVQVRVRVKKAGVVVTMDCATARKGEDYNLLVLNRKEDCLWCFAQTMDRLFVQMKLKLI